jgi:tRNA-splicing ligase RtcB
VWYDASHASEEGWAMNARELVALDIRKVMEQQTDLVDVVARFDPKFVKMSDDGKSED